MSLISLLVFHKKQINKSLSAYLYEALCNLMILASFQLLMLIVWGQSVADHICIYENGISVPCINVNMYVVHMIF